MTGLVDADTSGSLAATVDELFEFMQKRYKIIPDLSCWSLRIRAHLHSKFLNPSAPSLEPARIFYHEMLSTFPNSHDELNELRADLVVTAVSRRLWSFANWILTEWPSSSATLSFQNKIANASGLFLDASSVPILRFLVKNNQKQTQLHRRDLDSIIHSHGFNQQLLLFCWRQGRFTSDLALHALRTLCALAPNRIDWWLETAQGCLNRELPRDFYSFEAEEAKDRLIALIHRLKCQEAEIKEFEQEILHQKLLIQ